MALGTVTVNSNKIKNGSQPILVDDISLPLDASYPTGGYSGLPALLQAQTKDQREILHVENIGASSSVYTCRWDVVNQKLALFSGGTEVANATNLGAVTLRLLVQSR